MSIRRRWVWISGAIAAFLTVAVLLFAAAVPLRSETLRKRIVDTLSDRLNSNVTLDDLSLHVLPRLHAEGRGLVVNRRDHPDQAPLIAIKQFRVDAGLFGVWRKHVAHVTVEGLVITISPDDEDADDKGPDTRPHPVRAGGDTPSAETASGRQASPNSSDVVLDTLDANGTELVIIPREKNKNPRVWSIHTLRMHDVSAMKSWPFEATLTNGVPPGEIVTDGVFGPWNRDNPGGTPLGGKFTFDNADLGVFKGIGGTLS